MQPQRKALGELRLTLAALKAPLPDEQHRRRDQARRGQVPPSFASTLRCSWTQLPASLGPRRSGSDGHKTGTTKSRSFAVQGVLEDGSMRGTRVWSTHHR